MNQSRQLLLVRIAFVGLCVAVAPFMFLKQFQGLEGVLGLTDKAAHVIAFYGLTMALFVVVPKARRQDLCLFAVLGAIAVEIIQHFTGRSVSIGDFLAGAAGVGAAWAPGRAEEIRRSLRGDPDRRANPATRMAPIPAKIISN